MAVRSALINVMIGAVRKAARALIRDFGEVQHLQVSKKGPADFVSAADRHAEDILYNELRKVRPAYGFLMEERGVVEGTDTSNRWLIDPLDGTTNFLHGLPHFAISVALERDGNLIAGVVYEPIHDEMFWAEKGGGAYLNDRRIRVSARRQMDESIFATGIPFKGRSDHAVFLRQLGAVMAVTAGVRRFGAAALDLAYVAAGRYEGFWETGLHPWDMGAGIVLIREAGGYVTGIGGGRDPQLGNDILAANDHLHRDLLSIVGTATNDEA
jgi:myo-inositol-1(or 4)-monophosphatase